MRRRLLLGLLALALLALLALLGWRARVYLKPDLPPDEVPPSSGAVDAALSRKFSPPTPRVPRALSAPALSTEGSCSGRVVDPTGAPVADAQVLAWKGRERPVEGRTDVQGGFFLDNLPPGRYTVTAHSGQFRDGRHDRVEVAPGLAFLHIEIRLGEGGGRLLGTITDSGAGPIPGALVVVREYNRAAALAISSRAVADAQGRYELRVPEGFYGVSVLADGYAPVPEQRVEFQGASAVERTVDFQLEPAARISGRVVMAGDRRPVPLALIGAMLVSGQEPQGTRGAQGARELDLKRLVVVPTNADDRGEFLVTGLRPGRYRLHAQKAELAGALSTPVDVGPGALVEGIEIAIAPSGSLSGTIRTTSGAPVPRASISLLPVPEVPGPPRFASSSADGTYRIVGILPGAYRLEVSDLGQVRSSTRISLEGSLKKDVLLSATVSVNVLILDQDGKPVEGARISASSNGMGPDGAALTADASTLSDEDGKGLLKALGPGRIVVSAALGSRRGHASIDQVSEGATRDVTVTVSASPGP